MDIFPLLNEWVKISGKPRVKQSATDAFKTASKRAIQKKTVEATCDLIGHKIYDKITKVWKNSHKNNLQTVRNEDDKETPNEMYTSSEERQ